MAMKEVKDIYPLSQFYAEHIVEIVRIVGKLGRGVSIESDGAPGEDSERAVSFYLPRESFRIATADNCLSMEMNLKGITYLYDHTDRFYDKSIHRLYDYHEQAFKEKRSDDKWRGFRRGIVWYGLEVLILALSFIAMYSVFMGLLVIGAALLSFTSRMIAHIAFSFFWGWFASELVSQFGISLLGGLENVIAFFAAFVVSLCLHLKLEQRLEGAYDM